MGVYGGVAIDDGELGKAVRVEAATSYLRATYDEKQHLHEEKQNVEDSGSSALVWHALSVFEATEHWPSVHLNPRGPF